VFVFGLLVAVFCGAGAGAPYAAGAQGAQGETFSVTRLYYAMVGGALEKWDFYKDGTFLHQGAIAGSGTAVRHSERGTYQIQGNVLQLQITRNATAFLTPGTSSRGNTTQMGASRNTNAETRQMKIQLVGPEGENGVVLNGVTFKVRHWN
jgi:hypothetical protein